MWPLAGRCLPPPRPPGPNQPGTSGLWVHGMGKPPQYRVQRPSTDFCVPPREPFRPISTTGGLWGDGRASEAIATPTGGPPSRIRRSKASGGGAGCRAVATRGGGAAGAFRGFGERRNAGRSPIARQRGAVDFPAGQTPSHFAPSYPNGAFYFELTKSRSLSPRRLSPPGRCLRRRSWPTGGANARHRRSSGPLGRHRRGEEREEATSSRGGAEDVICLTHIACDGSCKSADRFQYIIPGSRYFRSIS